MCGIGWEGVRIAVSSLIPGGLAGAGHGIAQQLVRAAEMLKHKIENFRSNSTWKIIFPFKKLRNIVNHRK